MTMKVLAENLFEDEFAGLKEMFTMIVIYNAINRDGTKVVDIDFVRTTCILTAYRVYLEINLRSVL